MKYLLRLLTIEFLALVAWLTITFYYVKAGQPDDYLPALASLFFPLIFVAFLWAAWTLFPRATIRWQILGRVLVSLLAMGVWLAISLLVVSNFQLSLGGRV
ncbi:hypothetical protein CSC70_08405 [Pseudoxanthomonas kalamensis DSM 18571]|uniref:hypothetical protein n=1 Tax=Pseudoxanthomonas kalamensis TaxID=289483 RepID=UPI0013907D0E|nr:hypothetical protein [Pseudoxanthomonas kalamensis]KAF1710661.1 hypothetical protein CSC70_08405 [Pseudoxanthomonas kalamensis DSM 18571]